MELILEKKASVLGGTLLVAGCCMGAGMLGLPIVSAMSGFIPSTLAMLVCYFFATSTGLLLLEATLWFEHKVSLFSIADFAFGRSGKVITSLLFLFLYYCLFVAYIDGGGELFATGMTSLFNVEISREIGMGVCILMIAMLTYAGTRVSDIANRYLMCGLLVAFVVLVATGISKVDPENLLYTKWTATLSAMPIMLVCFGYQNIVPSLTAYLKRNVEMVRFAILIGNMIPFAIYLVWNYLILGLLPLSRLGGFGLDNLNVVEMLQSVSSSTSISLFVNVFSFFAIFTSVLPNSISFMDFLGDGLRSLPLAKPSKHLLVLEIFLVPPALFSFFIPNLFLKALGLAGGLADVLLLGILPVAVVWVGRYRKKIEGPYAVAGGKPFLVLVFMLSIFFLVVRN